MEKEIPALDFLIQETETALEKGCLFAALLLSLVLPDSCSWFEYRKLRHKGHVGRRYVRWLVSHGFAENSFTPVYSEGAEISLFRPSADFIYALRCSLFHTGGVEEKVRGELRKLVFVLEEKNSSGAYADLFMFGEYHISIRRLVQRILSEAKATRDALSVEAGRKGPRIIIRQRAEPDFVSHDDNSLR